MRSKFLTSGGKKYLSCVHNQARNMELITIDLQEVQIESVCKSHELLFTKTPCDSRVTYLSISVTLSNFNMAAIILLTTLRNDLFAVEQKTALLVECKLLFFKMVIA